MSTVVHIDPPSEEARRLWAQALKLAAELGAGERWALVGGLMVQLHAFERDSGSRLTADADFLGDSRRRPAMTVRMAEVLTERGAEMAMPPVSTVARAEVVHVSLAGADPVPVRRPSLLGAILIKARVVKKQREEKFESDRQDLIRLLGFVDDPRAMGEELRKSERKWLREVEQLLDFGDGSLADLFSAADLASAEGAYRLLVA